MKSLRVLVADDNPVNLKIMVSALRGLGHTGVIVKDGEKAVRCWSESSFDLVLLDVSMPVMDGLQALAIIRQKEKLGARHTPVLMVTAHDLPSDVEKFLRAGADGNVAKPVDIALLDAEIRRVLAV